MLLVALHKNPVVREALVPPLRGLADVRLVEPLEYDDFAWALRRAHVVLSDSGGVQEEAPSLGTPVLVLRDDTERPEAVAAGTVRLVGTQEDVVVAAVQRLWADEAAHAAMARAVNPYGDGHAVPRSTAALRHLLRGGPRPEEFGAPRRVTSSAVSRAAAGGWRSRSTARRPRAAPRRRA